MSRKVATFVVIAAAIVAANRVAAIANVTGPGSN